jgi:hypothetical protein
MIYGKGPEKTQKQGVTHQIAQSEKTKLQEGKAAKALRLKALVTKMNQKRVVTNLMRFNL